MHAPYPVSSPFGPRRTGFHHGVDLRMRSGTKLYAPFDGTLYKGSDGAYGRYWKLVTHKQRPDGSRQLIVTRGAHLSRWMVGGGQKVRVRAGQLIALSGGAKGADGAGNSTGAHLHYEFEADKRKMDPMKGSGRLGQLFHPA